MGRPVHVAMLHCATVRLSYVASIDRQGHHRPHNRDHRHDHWIDRVAGRCARLHFHDWPRDCVILAPAVVPAVRFCLGWFMALRALMSASSSPRRFLSRYGVLCWGLLILGLGGLFLLRKREEAEQIQGVLAGASPGWIVAIVLIQLVALGISGLTYLPVLRRLGHRVPWPRMVDVHLQRHVASTLSPIPGPASLYVMVRGLKRDAVGTEDAIFAAMLRSTSGTAGFVALLIPAFLLRDPSGVAAIGAGALALIFGSFLLAFRLVLSGDETPEWVPERLRAGVDRVRSHGVRAGDMVLPAVLAFSGHVVSVFSLYAALWAVGQEPTLAMALFGYATGMLFALVAPVFHGLGFVEVSMAIALEGMGVPAPAALGAALLFRLGDLWLPLLLGLAHQGVRRAAVRSFAPHLPAAATGAAGAVAIVSALSGASATLMTGSPPIMSLLGGIALVIISALAFTRRIAPQVGTAAGVLTIAPWLAVAYHGRIIDLLLAVPRLA